MPQVATKPSIQRRRDKLEEGVRAPDLSPGQAKVLTYILQCWLSGFIPTYREIGNAMDFSSPNASWSFCVALEKKGYLEAEDEVSGIILSDKALELVL